MCHIHNTIYECACLCKVIPTLYCSLNELFMLKYLSVCVSKCHKCQNKREKANSISDPQNQHKITGKYANAFCNQYTNVLSCQQTYTAYILYWPSGKHFKTPQTIITGICCAELQNICRKFSFVIFIIKMTHLHTKQNIILKSLVAKIIDKEPILLSLFRYISFFTNAEINGVCVEYKCSRWIGYIWSLRLINRKNIILNLKGNTHWSFRISLT